MKFLDCRALMCPHPVVETRKLMLAAPGTLLTVLVGDETARENIRHLAGSLGYAVKTAETEGGYSLELSPGVKAADPEPKGAQGKTVVFIASEAMGSGNDELGRLLLRNFLFTLAEMEPAPDTILFVNAGVKLAARSSEALEALEKLACMGTDIASCGLCLDFFHLKDQLATGRVTNMLEIAETLRTASRTIRP